MMLYRHIQRLGLPAVSVIVIAVAAGSAFSQTPVLSSTGELAPIVKALREGRNPQVLEYLKQTVKDNKLNAEAWYFLGIAYLQHNDSRKAAGAFDHAKELQPDLDASIHAQLAYVQVLRNKLKVALPEVTKALEIDANNVDALYTMAALNLRNGERDEAIKNADAIISLKPDLAEGYLLRSTVLLGFKRNVASMQEENRERAQRYQAAADALERYLNLTNDKRAAEAWQEQLESLKFFAAQEPLQAGLREVYLGSEVSTKFRVIYKPEPMYTEAARAEQVAGTVVLRCVFASDGTIQHVLVLQSLTRGLTEASIAALRRTTFEPAMINGKPVSTFAQLEYNFQLY